MIHFSVFLRACPHVHKRAPAHTYTCIYNAHTLQPPPTPVHVYTNVSTALANHICTRSHMMLLYDTHAIRGTHGPGFGLEENAVVAGTVGMYGVSGRG